MNADYFRTLFDYGYWARDKLFAVMETMTDEEYQCDLEVTYGSVRGILTHCLDTEYGWRCRIEDKPDSERITQEQLLTPQAMMRGWREDEIEMRAYLAGLTDEAAAGSVALGRPDGSKSLWPRWQLLSHLANHSTQHRSEAAEALTRLGHSPGNLDMLFYFIEKRSS